MTNHGLPKCAASDIEITFPSSVKHIASASGHLLVQVPHMVCLLIVVSAFLFHLDRQGEREQASAVESRRLDDMRIETFNIMQERSLEVLMGLDKQMEEQSAGFHDMSRSMDELNEVIRQRM